MKHTPIYLSILVSALTAVVVTLLTLSLSDGEFPHAPDKLPRATGVLKEFTLSANPTSFEYAFGKMLPAWGYNSRVPGPEIRVVEGDLVRVVFTNKLPAPTSIHWHGINVPNNQDGVPGVTQKAIEPGQTYTYEFLARPAGTHFYHTHGSSHGDEAAQLDMGLSGAFIVEPVDYKKPDKEYTLMLDEWQDPPATGEHSGGPNPGQAGGHAMNYNVFTINGRAFPDTKALMVRSGEIVRLRLINAGTSTIHPMHLHGHQFRVVAVDGNEVPPSAQLTRNTLPLHPGETFDIEFRANNPGIWVFHCHELHHAEGGMIVPVVYKGFDSMPSSTGPAPHTPPPAQSLQGTGH